MDFKEIINQNKQNVQNIIKLITKENNEDIEQEVYIKAYKNKDKYKEQGKMKSWIGTIARNLSKDYLKSYYVKNVTQIENEKINQIKDNSSSIEEKMELTDRQKEIINAIENLKEKYKSVVMLYEIKNYSYEQISRELNIPTGTVKSRLYNAKKELYENLAHLI